MTYVSILGVWPPFRDGEGGYSLPPPSPPASYASVHSGGTTEQDVNLNESEIKARSIRDVFP